MLKSHTCGELRSQHIGQSVTLAGWIHRRRDHGGVIFIDVRDREGIVQVVFNPELSKQSHEEASQWRNEFVVQVKGEVARRPAGTENSRMPTGEIEVIARSAVTLSRAKTPPFYINEEQEVDESLRLKYRYLDFRRPRMKDNLILRHRVVKFMRDFLDARGFVEVETPILIKSTPEGARDYLVPSRLQPGKFYALPQSPQQLKQLLMVGGMEKYYQIARCFRDEDLRADRQPEFTQLDLEMSFVEEEDVLRLMEDMFTQLVQTITPQFKLITPFPSLSYAEAVSRYGSDKPDVRFGLHLHELSDILGKSEFEVFRQAVEKGGKIKGISVPGCAGYSRRELDELTQIAKSCGAKGLVTLSINPDVARPEDVTLERVRSIIARFLKPEELQGVVQRLEAKGGDLLLLAAGDAVLVDKVLGELRKEMGKRLNLADPDLLAFAFIRDFPLLEWNQEEGHWQAMHHPFTAPMLEDMPLLDTAPDRARGRHYDLVCNGFELSSGSLRIYTRELQEKVFKLLGYKQEEIEERFGHMLEAFDYGAPPHGGIAPGIDRFVMLLARETNIREVIAYPKTQSAADLLMNAPSPVSDTQLRDLHLKIVE
ncbi:MAG: aspartate--tRNA ligase [Chloroflexi bacterium]|nr:aspartate--tRNA ligase [Chloroflexota bacterium]